MAENRTVVITHDRKYHTLQQVKDRIYKDIPGAQLTASEAETAQGAIIAGRIEDSIETYRESGEVEVISDTEGKLAEPPS